MFEVGFEIGPGREAGLHSFMQEQTSFVASREFLKGACLAGRIPWDFTACYLDASNNVLHLIKPNSRHRPLCVCLFVELGLGNFGEQSQDH